MSPFWSVLAGFLKLPFLLFLSPITSGTHKLDDWDVVYFLPMGNIFGSRRKSVVSKGSEWFILNSEKFRRMHKETYRCML